MNASARTDESDASLVARCLEGDHDAWNGLLVRHGGLVWAIVRRQRLSEQDAADAFQNTWTLALEQLAQLRQPELFERWLGRVARNQALRIRRGYGIARSALPKLAQDDVDDVEPHEELARVERRSAVHAGLARLGERCAALLRLLYMAAERPAYTDVAAQMDMPIGSIGPTRARCLERLRALLGDSHDD